jgi:hypothetical protein
MLTQAMIGLVSQSLLGVALEVNDEGVVLHFAVSAGALLVNRPRCFRVEVPMLDGEWNMGENTTC